MRADQRSRVRSAMRFECMRMCNALNADMHACVSLHVGCCCCSSISELQRVLSESGALPLRSLVIIPDKQVWLVNIDVLVMDNGGNLLDAIVMAVKAAMLTTTYEQHARIGLAAVIGSCSPQLAAVRPQAAAESLAHCASVRIARYLCMCVLLSF